MLFKGTITAAMPVASGTSKNGKSWKRASYVMIYDETNAQYPKSILFDVMGDRIEQFALKQGGQYEVEIDFSTREFNGRTFMSASCWKAVALNQPSPQPVAQVTAPVAAAAPEQSDLPF